jgi:hypothetical protein
VIKLEDHDPFDDALIDLIENTAWYQQFIQHHSYNNNNNSDDLLQSILQNFTVAKAGRSLYPYYFTYDAVIALALAACEAPQAAQLAETSNTSDTPTSGRLLLQQLLKTEFQCVSGPISFDPETGTRSPLEKLFYQVQNLILSDERSDSQRIRFDYPTAFVDLSLQNGTSPNSNMSSSSSEDAVQFVVPFIYPNNATRPPPALPPVEHDFNLIPTSVLAFGLSIGGLVMLTSIGWMIWTVAFRKKDVVRVSQPTFLCLLLLGNLITVSSVIPMSMQEDENELQNLGTSYHDLEGGLQQIDNHALDIACMATPWLNFCRLCYYLLCVVFENMAT